MTTQTNVQNDSGAAVLDRMLEVLGEKQDKAIADYFDKSSQSVSNARSGKVPMSWINDFCKQNDVTIDWLMTGKGDEPRGNQHTRRTTDSEPAMISSGRDITIHNTLEDGRSNVAAVLHDYTQMASSVEGQLNFWRAVFEGMSPVCILKDGKVLYQNASNRKMCTGAVEGEQLCTTCQGGGDGFPACPGCAVRTAGASGQSSTSYTTIESVYYVIQSDILVINGEAYQVVLAVPIKRCGAMQNRIEEISRDISLIPSLLAPFPICCTDGTGNVLFQSPSFMKVFGLLKGEIKTSIEMIDILSDRIEPEAIGILYALVRNAHKNNLPGELKIMLDGKSPLWLVLRPISSEDGENNGICTYALQEDEFSFFRAKGML